MERRPRVGIFDSGIGGLSVLKQCLNILPYADYLYLGDNARAPYGSRSTEEITAFTAEALDVFREREVDVAVLACNTATAVCINEMRMRYEFPIVGVEPAVSLAARRKHVLVLVTPRTAESARLHTLLSNYPDVHFEVVALPNLAAAIEAHFTRSAPLTLSDHLPAESACDCAVLGCTHYALIAEEIERYLRMPVYDGAEGAARRASQLVFLGRDFHLYPPMTTTTTPEISVEFLGNSKELNENVYKTNIRFQYFRKKL